MADHMKVVRDALGVTPSDVTSDNAPAPMARPIVLGKLPVKPAKKAKPVKANPDALRNW